MSSLTIRDGIFSVNTKAPVELTGETKTNAFYNELRIKNIYRGIKLTTGGAKLPIVLNAAEGDAFYDTTHNTLGTVYVHGYDSEGNTIYKTEMTLIERNYSIETNRLSNDLITLARKYRTSSVSYSEGTITARNIVFNKSYRDSLTGPQGQKARNTTVKKRYTTETDKGALLDQNYAHKNIRAYGKVKLDPKDDGLYEPYPYYTVVFSAKPTNSPAMHLLCGRFIVPMESFELSNLVYIFKYPEWMLNDTTLIDSIDSVDLRLTETDRTKLAHVIGGHPNFGYNPENEYLISGKDILGNDSLVNYSGYLNRYQPQN